MGKEKLVNLDGATLETQNPTVDDNIVRNHIKVLGNKVLLRVVRKKHSGILTIDNKTMEFEPYFPILGVGPNVVGINVGEYAGLEPGGKWGITKLFGEEFLIVDSFRIDHVVTAEYAKMHSDYETVDENIFKEMVKETGKANTNIAPTNAPDTKGFAITGEWKTKSKPN